MYLGWVNVQNMGADRGELRGDERDRRSAGTGDAAIRRPVRGADQNDAPDDQLRPRCPGSQRAGLPDLSDGTGLGQVAPCRSTATSRSSPPDHSNILGQHRCASARRRTSPIRSGAGVSPPGGGGSVDPSTCARSRARAGMAASDGHLHRHLNDERHRRTGPAPTPQVEPVDIAFRFGTLREGPRYARRDGTATPSK